MSQEPSSPPVTRLAVVLAGYPAAAPPGIKSADYTRASLTDSYEVLADLSEIDAGLAGPQPWLGEIGWPGDRVINTDGRSVRAIAEQVDDDRIRELIVVPADVPDLPGMITAKIAKGLHRADVCLAPEIGSDGLVAAGIRLPWPSWVDRDLDLDHDPYEQLSEVTPRRNLVVHTPGWHRMRRPESVHLLDPGLEGWDNVRLLLSGSTVR